MRSMRHMYSVCVLLALILVLPAIAEVPQTISYQGRLLDSSGDPVADGPYLINFTIWDDPTADDPGNILWTSGYRSVQVTDGLFEYGLGSAVTLPDTLFSAGTQRYLGIQVGVDPEISPRTQMATSPYAYQALRTDSSDFASDVADDCITSQKIVDGTILFGDMATNGASAGQIMKWDGNMWQPADDETSTGGSGNWSVTDSVLYTNDYWGVARGDAENAVYGDSAHTMVNLGVACTTGTMGGTWFSATVAGGRRNSAIANASTVSGGGYNRAEGVGTTVGGGSHNAATGIVSTVAGGQDDTASGMSSTIGGGVGNMTSGDHSTVAGGLNNLADGWFSVVGGGWADTVQGWFASVYSGYSNSAGDDEFDSAAFVGSGVHNAALDKYAVVGGGNFDTASGRASTVCGGAVNRATNSYAFVGGGDSNSADGEYSTAGGGAQNAAFGRFSVVAGGLSDTASGSNSAVLGGRANKATGTYSVVGGGMNNVADGSYSVVVGGKADTITAYADYSYLFGIGSKLTQDSTFMVDMPHIRFGDEVSGYEFPSADGTNGQMLQTDGAGQLNWVTPTGGANYWSVTDSVLYTNDYWGIARGDAGNVLYGDSVQTMINLGVACTTGFSGQNYYCTTVGNGYGNAAVNNFASVFGGVLNRASDWGATVVSGQLNQASGTFSVVLGGSTDTVSGGQSAILGASHSKIAGSGSVIGGGRSHSVAGSYSAILGGFGDTITATADYSYLFGIESKLTQDSTFMVDMPHIRFGDEAGGYEFPATIGADGQILQLSGGQLNWVTPASGATYWSVIDSVLYTDDYWGLARGGAGNQLNGDSLNTMVNWGVACTTGTAAVAAPYTTVGGGYRNKISAYAGTVSGGTFQEVSDDYGFVGGGYSNSASSQFSSVVGGRGHIANGYASAIGGGYENSAAGDTATVAGGYKNTASGHGAAIGGGARNLASGDHSTVGGGVADTANAAQATVGGGYSNLASYQGATVSGGNDNIASGIYSSVGGGVLCVASGHRSVVGGGSADTASGETSVVAGGYKNVASGSYTVIGGGQENSAVGKHSGVFSGYQNVAGSLELDSGAFVGGGYQNSADGQFSVIAGGRENSAQGYTSFIGGGQEDTTTADWCVIGGGRSNLVEGILGTISGGDGNSISSGGQTAAVGGGNDNTASGSASTIGGGSGNTVSGSYATVSGGDDNTAGGYCSNVGGGWENTAGGYISTIAGGRGHSATGDYATIAGGLEDTLTAGADYSLAFGRRVYVNNSYRVVLFDQDYSGRLGINRDDHYAGGIGYPIHVGTSTSNGNGAYLTNGGTWTSTSSRDVKENFEPVDGAAVLELLADMPVDSWQYRESDERHIGPVSEDFVAAFDVGASGDDGGRDNKHLSANDVAGVALIGVKQLHRLTRELERKTAEIDELRAETKELRQLVEQLLKQGRK